jgi:DNA-binding MarR family transcriptional regulator
MTTNPSHAKRLVAAFAIFHPAYLRWVGRCAAGAGMSQARLRVMEALQEGPQSMSALKERLGVSATNITGLVDGLEADGLVCRTSHPSDRRVTLISLTDKALGQRGSSWDEHADAVAALFEGLPLLTQEQLLGAIEHLIQRLREAPNKP